MEAQLSPRPAVGWGPAGRRAAVSVTFDHLGEAAAIEQGRWPETEPVGRHVSVTQVMPALLPLLAAADVSSSFFVEGWNCDIYPDTLRATAGAGHDIGYHGWRHESWARVSETQAADLLDRGSNAFDGLGITLSGFRAPGGSHPSSVFPLLHQRGYTYFSLPGREVTVWQGMVSLPYEWAHVDALYYSPTLRGLREGRGMGAEPLPPDCLRAVLENSLDQCLESGGYLALLFHTQLLDQPDRFAVFRDILQRVTSSADVWCAPDREVAAWVLEHRADFPAELQLDNASWDPSAVRAARAPASAPA
jgi:peptidoglycan/xylan/chitin deacetylase (PgdA/CDA1 family)